jgi:hydrogenase-4 component B
MPTTASLFLFGSLAICGLPPLCGFVSEWLLYLTAFADGATLKTQWSVLAIAAVPTLALIGGLAVACFTRTFGVVFLGQARSAATSQAQEAGSLLRGPMLASAALCGLLGLWPRLGLWLVEPVLTAGLHLGRLPQEVLLAAQGVIRGAALLLCLILALALLRARLLRDRSVEEDGTWGCGYDSPTPRMQYTSTSFSEPLLLPLTEHTRVDAHGPDGYFPAQAFYEEHRHDLAGERALIPAVHWAVGWLSRLRVLQQGRVQLYLTYVFVTVVVLLFWQLATPR